MSIALMANQLQILVGSTVVRTTDLANLAVVGLIALPNLFIRELHAAWLVSVSIPVV